jgi:hypothetical protein
MIGEATFWERWKTAVRGEGNLAPSFWAILLGALKSGIAEIATANSSRQFGREEEKE